VFDLLVVEPPATTFLGLGRVLIHLSEFLFKINLRLLVSLVFGANSQMFRKDLEDLLVNHFFSLLFQQALGLF